MILILLNIILIQYFINYWGDSLRAVLSQLAFFLVIKHLCFNLSIKQLRKRAQTIAQSLSQIHT